jgi:hypothetical protein
MLIDFLSPPGCAWNVEQIRRALVPQRQSQLEVAELKPEWNSYDALLSSPLEVTYAG